MELRLTLVESVKGNVQVSLKVGVDVKGDRLKVVESVPESVRGIVQVSLRETVTDPRVKVIVLLEVGGGVTV